MATERINGKQGHFHGKLSQWQKRADDHKEKQLINPFSEWDRVSPRPVISKDDPNYGRPVEGSLTEHRGKQAHKHISNAIVELCQIICSLGDPNPDGTHSITFGRLFLAYTRISDTVVGLLIRGRKYGFVQFEGEMLYQRQDDNVVITCLQVPESV
ncbi:unnamed protein product [Candidula unifasciata]|uniref:Costars domain-containing protein n=1 Tax=Candidula unifasciata TaxID=100452 RepID=A0A8S3ZLK2_9EUPU|nr:unnamed protein product [Candidula unifasciata]